MTTTASAPPDSLRAKYPPIQLGPKISIWPPVVLAPMAGVTNAPYRRICNEFGAGLCVSEMVSSRGILDGYEKTWKLAHFDAEERPRSIQLFGCDPHAMGEATRRVRAELDVDHIDINFGCPVPKITRKGMGAAALLDSKNCRAVVHAVVKAADPAPVTIKVRLGMDEERITYLEAGKIAAGEGCAYIALHARTAKQLYTGQARWEHIGTLKSKLPIPVLGNGDIMEAPDAFRMLEATGCDGVVIGRGCLGNPWLFRNLLRMFEGAGKPERPSLDELVAVIRRHFQLLSAHYAEFPELAAINMRKFGTWYPRGLKGSATLRRDFQKLTSERDLEVLLERLLESGYSNGLRPPDQPTR